MMSSLGRAARNYAARGWRVFPVEVNGKAPLTPHGFKDATTNREVVTDWWERFPLANIGFDIPVDMLILDFDPRNGCPIGGAEALGLPPTKSVATAGGGWHFYYFLPTEAVNTETFGKYPGVDGVDIKRGGRGYVILPPSQIGEGKYGWLEGTHDIAMLTLDQLTPLVYTRATLGDALVPQGSKRFFPWETGSARGLSYLTKALGTLSEAEPGTRNNTLFRVTAALLGLVAAGELDEEATLEKVRDTAIGTGLEFHEVMAAMRSAYERRAS